MPALFHCLFSSSWWKFKKDPDVVFDAASNSSAQRCSHDIRSKYAPREHKINYNLHMVFRSSLESSRSKFFFFPYIRFPHLTITLRYKYLCVCVKSPSVVSDFVALQAPLSLGVSWQEHWSGLPFPSPMQESEKWKWRRSVVSNLATPWTAAHQAPPSMGFSRQEYWSGVPSPSLNS